MRTYILRSGLPALDHPITRKGGARWGPRKTSARDPPSLRMTPLLEVGGGGGIGLPDGDHLHADAARGRALEASVGLVEEIFRQVFRRGIQSLEGLDVVHHLMIEAVDGRLHHR